MQKYRQAQAMAERQAKRRVKKYAESIVQRDRNAYNREMILQERERLEAVKRERARRREDWELGTLSPWRGASAERLHEEGFGTFKIQNMARKNLAKPDQPKHFMIRKGDRVVIMEGHERSKGRIAKVASTDEEKATVELEGVNLLDYEVDSAAKKSTDKFVDKAARSISYNHVRLVYPFPDPETGIPKDCILTNLVAREKRFDRFRNKEVWERWLEPHGVRIPWSKESEAENLVMDEQMDTDRKDLNDTSFEPFLFEPPMPPSVIDELRNKYSKFRVRHDPEWVAKKVREDEDAQIERQRMEVMMPRGAKNIARFRDGTVPPGQGLLPLGGGSRMEKELSDEDASTIGEHMARKGIELRDGQLMRKDDGYDFPEQSMEQPDPGTMTEIKTSSDESKA